MRLTDPHVMFLHLALNIIQGEAFGQSPEVDRLVLALAWFITVYNLTQTELVKTTELCVININDSSNSDKLNLN